MHYFQRNALSFSMEGLYDDNVRLCLKSQLIIYAYDMYSDGLESNRIVTRLSSASSQVQ